MSDEPIQFPVDEVPAEEQFYVDDFFAVEDAPGIKVEVKIRGRLVPFWLKRGLSLEDEMAAESVAVKRRVLPDGRVVIEGMDDAALVVELLYRHIKEWPFTDRKTGEKFPITRENIRKLMGGAEALASAIKRLNTDGEAVLAPFAAASAEA